MLDFLGKLAVNSLYPIWMVVDTIKGSFAHSVRENCYAQGISATICERVGHEAYNNAMGLIGYGATAAAIAGSGAHYLKNIYRNHQYCRYIEKSDREICSLTQSEVNAFELGVAGSRGVVRRASTLLKWDSWRHGRAYYAGFEAGTLKDEGLISKVTNQRRS